jgi:hypothetical protein
MSTVTDMPLDVQYPPTDPALADCWAPVPMPWRLVEDGELFVGGNGVLWVLHTIRGTRGAPVAVASPVADPEQVHEVPVRPDELVRVLVPTTERDVVAMTRELLGAQVIARRIGAAA